MKPAVLFVVFGLFGCSDRSVGEADGAGDRTASESAGEDATGVDPGGDPWHGLEPADCAVPELDAEVLACGGQAWQLAVSGAYVFWVAGTRELVEPSVPSPALYSVETGGGPRLEIARLPENPETIAADLRVGFSTVDAVYEAVGFDVDVLDTQGASKMRALGADLYWAGKRDGVVWRSDAEGHNEVALSDGMIGLFDVDRLGNFAWVDQDNTGLHSTASDGPLADLSAPVADLRIAGDFVYWASTGEALFRTPLPGGETELVASEPWVTSFDVEGLFVYYATEEPAVSGLRRASIETGEVDSIAEYDREVVSDVEIADGVLYWIDGRILRAAID